MALCDATIPTGWLTPVDEHCLAQVPRLTALLSPDERARVARLIFPRDRDLHTVARAHVRTVLSRYADIAPAAWRFEPTGMGRPHIANALPSPLFFSLTHTRGLVASVVWSHAECGIDAERLDRKMDALALSQHSFAPAEAEALASLEEEQRPRRFLELWTLKEAFAKAMGQGLSLGLDRVRFDTLEPVHAAFDPTLHEDAARWSFRCRQATADHLVSVALRGPMDGFVLHSIAL